MGLLKALAYILEPLLGPAAESRTLGTFRGRRVVVPLTALRSHAYLVGGTGTGKSRLLRLLAEQDIAAGHGLCLIDPHGDLCEALVAYLATLPGGHPALARAVLIDPTDREWAVGFNPLQVPPGDDLYPHVLELLTVFRKLWADAEFRGRLVAGLAHPEARAYWQGRFGPLPARTKAEWIESTLNKVSAFVSDPWIRDMVGQRRSTIDPRQWMDDGAFVLVNLAKGRLKQNSDLVGALLVAKLQEAALSRVDLPEGERRPFRLYVDEFQHYATASFQDILSEARKYALAIVMAHQTLAQLDRTLQASVLANAKVQVYFRPSRQDAEVLARQAFRATGRQVKFQLKRGGLAPEPRTNPVFVPVGEEMEGYINLLLDMGARQALLNVRGAGPPVPFRTADAPDRPRPTAALRGRLVARVARPRQAVRREITARTTPVPEPAPEDFWTP